MEEGDEQALMAEQDQMLIDYAAGLGDPSNGVLTLYHGAKIPIEVDVNLQFRYIVISGSFAAILLATMSAAVVIKVCTLICIVSVGPSLRQ